MFTSLDQIQKNQQSLFQGAVIKGQGKYNAKTTGLNTARPMKTAQMKMTSDENYGNQSYEAAWQQGANIDIDKYYSTPQTDVLSRHQPLPNKYQQLFHDIMPGLQQKDKSMYKGIAPDNRHIPNSSMMPNLVKDQSNVYKNTFQFEKTPLQSKLIDSNKSKNAETFHISGSEDIALVQNYQDQSFQSAKIQEPVVKKASRSQPIKMTMPDGMEGLDDLWKEDVDDVEALRQYCRLREPSANNQGFNKVGLKPLAYPMNGLEPVVSEQQMDYHRVNYHQIYARELNAKLSDVRTALLQYDQCPEDPENQKSITKLAQAIKHDGRGLINNEFFWESVCPVSAGYDPGNGSFSAFHHELGPAIDESFGSFENMIEQFTSLINNAVEGQEWGCLLFNTNTGQLSIEGGTDQNYLTNPCSHIVPLFATDAWLHTTVLYHRDFYPQATEELWKIVNWDKVEERYLAALE